MMQTDLFNSKRVMTVTGSRSITDESFIYSCLDDFLRIYKLNPQELILNSGNARGVDKISEAWAKDRGVEVKIFKPDWSKGKGAGLARNLEMVDSCGYVCGIWDGESRGTKHCFEYAKKQKKTVKVYTQGKYKGRGYIQVY